MANLKYKTRGDTNPKGKPRVYFCCHPEDFNAFFEAVSDEILAKQNCAVWYTDDANTARDEDFFADLKQMQLFVMPVTTKLLCTENAALNLEFKFAIENHIPVLPLMQESGLEQIFNQKCGDLQFLDKNNTDVTAISYDEKLEKYLSSVLVGDELAEKIRAAFDAYVFLSYRKKDRKYAQELMRLIHKNEFCRDIAIWYDEFLTPGENFNDTIKTALQKSGLFVLAVTPNLVNEINYIMTTEYPLARQEGKPILPAELVPTDKQKLSESYEGIPDCTDAHNEAELSNALLEAVKKMAIKENDGSPEHNFFIGLAYLSGIDVEVDSDRALKLITSSAEAGLTEAIDKLVEMYRNGIGIARSYETAIVWQEKKIALLENEYSLSPNDEALNNLFWEIVCCGDYCRELRKLEKAKYYYKKSLALCVNLPEYVKDLKIQYYLTICYERIGNTCKKQIDYSKAKEYYQKALTICTEIVKKSSVVDIRINISVCYGSLGYIYHSEGNLSKAKEYYQKELETCIELSKETKTAITSHNLSTSFNALGNLFLLENELTIAESYYKKSLEICTQSFEETKSTVAKRDMSISYEKLGNIYKFKDDLTGAKEFYQKALAITLELVENTQTAEAKRDLSVSYEELGNICKAKGNLTGAKEFYQKALEIRLELAESTETVEAKRDLLISYKNLGNVYEAEGNLQNAKYFYEKAFAMADEISEKTRTVGSMRDLSACLDTLGRFYETKSNLTKAKEYYEKELSICIKLINITKSAIDKLTLTYIYNKIGNIFNIEQNNSVAEKYYIKALDTAIAIIPNNKPDKLFKHINGILKNLFSVTKNIFIKIKYGYKVAKFKIENDIH